MAKEKLSVLFLSSWFPTRIIPTLGNFVQRHAEAVALKHHVTALIIQKDSAIVARQIEETFENGVRIIRVYYPKGNIILQKRQALNAGILYLKENGGFKFDLVQLNMVWKEGWQAVFIKKKFNIPFVISDNWTGYHLDQRGPLPWHIKRYMRWVANQASLLLPVTQHLEHAMRKLGFNKPSMIVPNVVNTHVFDVSEKQPTSSCVRFLHVSHLDNNHKNIQGILRVWKKFHAAHPNSHLEIGGDGDLQLLHQWIKREAIEPLSISTFGSMTTFEVAEKMKNADALVLFSNYENLPLVIIEAMACGLQVIATDVGGVAEHISNHPPHHLLAPRDELALESAMAQIKHLSIEQKKSIRTYAVNHFSQEKIAEAFSTAYLSILPS